MRAEPDQHFPFLGGKVHFRAFARIISHDFNGICSIVWAFLVNAERTCSAIRLYPLQPPMMESLSSSLDGYRRIYEVLGSEATDRFHTGLDHQLVG